MASVTTNSDIQVMANKVLKALIYKLDALGAFALGFESNANEGDVAKVEVHGITKDAAAYNKSSNNYSTVGADTTTFVDVTMDQKIKKTAEIEERYFGITDITKKLEGLATAVAYKVLLDIYNTLVAATYDNPEEIVGAASGFTADDLVDLEVVADDAEFDPENRYCLLSNAYTANLKKDSVLVANKAADVDPKKTWERFEEIANFKVAGSTVIKNVTGTAATENLVGFITDGQAIGIGMGVPAVIPSSIYEIVNVFDEATGLGIQLRKHIDPDTGSMLLNAVILCGYSAIDEARLTRVVSA